MTPRASSCSLSVERSDLLFLKLLTAIAVVEPNSQPPCALRVDDPPFNAARCRRRRRRHRRHQHRRREGGEARAEGSKKGERVFFPPKIKGALNKKSGAHGGNEETTRKTKAPQNENHCACTPRSARFLYIFLANFAPSVCLEAGWMIRGLSAAARRH